VQEIGDAPEPRDLRIEPQPVAAPRDPSLLGDRGRFDENETGAAECKTAEMNQMEIVDEAVMRAVHRHRRHHDAVAQCHIAIGHRLQQKRRGCGRFDRVSFPNRHCSSRNCVVQIRRQQPTIGQGKMSEPPQLFRAGIRRSVDAVATPSRCAIDVAKQSHGDDLWGLA
jgi:hypothetical protein